MKNKLILLVTFSLCLILEFNSCHKKFDEPPFFVQPDITVTTSIKALKAMHSMGAYEKITTDIIISGIVVGDDKNGNLYKQICIQDSTAGITINVGGSNLYVDYPIGRRVFIKCKGLYLSDDNRMIELGMIDNTIPGNPSLSPIPIALADSFLIKGNTGNAVIPKSISINQFHDSLQSMLIQIKDSVQFIATDTGLTYADVSASKASVNRTVSDCSGNKAIVYTSGYSNFAGIKTPSGKGVLTALYFVYKTTPELILRDTVDARLNSARCGASLMSIAALRALYSGSDVVLGSIAIKGIVISNSSNVAAGNMIIQDGNSGIDLYFGNSAATSKFSIGDSVKIDLTGGTLTNYKGMIEVNLPATALPLAALGTGKIVSPQIVTLAQLNNNIATLENTVVQINNAWAVSTSGTSYSGNKTLNDASGSATMYTSIAASFANSTMPITCQNWIGYANRYTTVQFQIRNTNDVVPASGCNISKVFSAVYIFSGVTTSSGNTDPTAVPIADSAKFGSFVAIGVSSNSSATARFSFTGWPTGAISGSNTFTGSLSATQYYEVTLAPSSGYKLDITSLVFTVQRSTTGVRQWAVRSSIDNFATNLPAFITPANAALQTNANNIFQIVDRATATAQTGCNIVFGSDHINLTGPIKLRFYGFNAESASGTFSLNSVTINGNTH
jgi:hypothetical protein